MTEFTRKNVFLALGAIAVLVLLFLVIWQAIVPDYRIAERTIILLAMLLYALLQIDILGGKLGFGPIRIVQESDNSEQSGPSDDDEHSRER